MASNIKLAKEDQESIEIARKYRLRLDTWKFQIFLLFEQGYTPSEIRYIIRKYPARRGKPTFRTINRYYYIWKMHNQSIKQD